MPAVKEGSIIEISYVVYSDFIHNLREWEFQSKYPHLWSEYEVGIPDFFGYVYLSQGNQNFFINQKRETSETYGVTFSNGSEASSHVSLSATVHKNRWVMKDVPALKKESFTTTIQNHISKIEFQLSQYRFPNQAIEEVMGSWKKVNEEMMKDEDFGLQLTKNNNWLDDDMKAITAGATTTHEKAEKIFAFVRNNFTCTGKGHMYLSDGLKTIFKNRKGNNADINILLVAMLKHEDIEANPVILSTRQNGYTHKIYPLMNRFNDVIASAYIDDKLIYLDATYPLLGFGRLDSDCLNGHARLMGKFCLPVYLEADSVLERKVTSVIIANSEKGGVEGFFQTTPGYYESFNVRETVNEKGVDAFFKNIKASYGDDIQIAGTGIDSLKNLDLPILEHYNFKLNNMDEEIIYFNPMMGEAYKENPFKSIKRLYPVEMPYTFDETYILNMEVPKGYKVDEIPKSAKVDFNDGEGYFEYMISNSGNTISMRSRLYMKRTYFDAEEYDSLKEFYGYVVKKQAEQIVFKKTKP